MASHAGTPERVLIGREAELAAVREVLNRAAGGQSETLLVFGESRRRQDCARPARGRQRCPVDIAAEWSVPTTAIDQRAPAAAPSRLPRSCSAGPAPMAAGWAGADRQGPALLYAWLQDLASAAPVVLLIDDVQWADQSTLDVLMYLVAGPSDRHFALLATVRSELLPDGHPFHRWLARHRNGKHSDTERARIPRGSVSRHRH